MRQQRVRMPMPSLAGARAIEPAHGQLGSLASASDRSLSGSAQLARVDGRMRRSDGLAAPGCRDKRKMVLAHRRHSGAEHFAT
jgi:hypothetical protein